MDKQHYDKIFWFCCAVELAGLVFLAALIWIPVPGRNESMANIAIGFITGTVIFIPLTFLLGGNALPQKKAETNAGPGTTTADISATITTQPKDAEPTI